MPVGPWLGQMAGQIGGQASGTAMGIAAQRIGKNYDRKQWVKDFETQAPRQMELERRMMEMQQQNQMEMWHDTNYGAQMKEIKNAGLNPAMMYGMSGGGGTTTGSAPGGAPQVKGTSTGTGSGVGGGGIGMGLLTKAQVDLMNAQTRKLNVDSDKTAGVDTENVKADTGVKNQTIENLIQGVASEKAKQALTEIQTVLGKNESEWQSGTMESRIQMATSNATEAAGRARTAEANGEISHQTYLDVIDGIRADVANKLIQGELMKAQTENTKQGTAESKQRVELSKAQIKEISEGIAQDWSRVIQGYKANEIGEERNRITEELGKLGIGAAAANGILGNLKEWADKNDKKRGIGKYSGTTEGRGQNRGASGAGQGRGRGGGPGGPR